MVYKNFCEIHTRDAKGFFEDPEPRGSPAYSYLQNPGVFILMIFAFFGGFLSTPGNHGVYFHYGFLQKEGINALHHTAYFLFF